MLAALAIALGGNCLAQKLVNPEKPLFVISENNDTLLQMKYNSDGNPTFKKELGGRTIVYSYDKEGNEIERKEILGDGSSKIISKSVYDFPNKISYKVYEDETIYYTWNGLTCTYTNSWNDKIEETYYDDKCKHLKTKKTVSYNSTTTEEYDKDGKLLSSVKLDADGEVSEFKKYTYSDNKASYVATVSDFDDDFNIIKKEVKQTIYYFPDGTYTFVTYKVNEKTGKKEGKETVYDSRRRIIKEIFETKTDTFEWDGNSVYIPQNKVRMVFLEE